MESIIASRLNKAIQLILVLAVDYRQNKNGQTEDNLDLSTLVPRTGFEPAHPCGRCDLNTVRLPISPSGPLSLVKGIAKVGFFIYQPNLF